MDEMPKIHDFLAIATPRDLAHLLGVRYDRHLVYNLYKLPPERRYRVFQISRRNGGTRTIATPRNALKFMQKTLSKILQDIYQPRPSVHGYLKDRSIVTNAERHVKTHCVLNIDLKDFFSSINFGRVRGMFMAVPFAFPAELATVLAQMCCHDNGLPLGAPTSPVIANIICARLDRQLQRLAQSRESWYTRYSDDITFSTKKYRFSPAIAIEQAASSALLGSALLAIIHANGFVINEDKTRLMRKNVRQEVTGLVVNAVPNIRRRDFRKIRAMIHAWEVYVHELAQQYYYGKHNYKSRHQSKEQQPKFEEIIRGKIAFYGSVKGKNDPSYLSVARKFNAVAIKNKIWGYRFS